MELSVAGQALASVRSHAFGGWSWLLFTANTRTTGGHYENSDVLVVLMLSSDPGQIRWLYWNTVGPKAEFTALKVFQWACAGLRAGPCKMQA
jgi:hypothetical protein